jgi:tetratricopeptide (TPR) repeat protein
VVKPLTAARLGAFATLAEGKTADALKQLDALATMPGASAVDIAFAPVNRAIVFVGGARYRDALAESAKALQSADSGQLPPGPTADLRRLSLMVSVAAEGRMGDAAGAAKTVAALQKEAAARPDDPNLKTAVHFAQAMFATAQKDQKAARMHFEMCSQQDFFCHWQALEVSRKAGDKEGAAAALGRLTKLYVRDPTYLYARAVATRGAAKSSN